MKIERPRGTRDFSPAEMGDRCAVQRELSLEFERYGYAQVNTPAFEHVELFGLKSGEEIKGHMYVFEDKKGREMCLRPEATASVCRMFSETLRASPKPLKLYYFGPMYRYEEPQKGRYREFWQFGMELIGPKNAESDAEAVLLAYSALKRIGLEFRLEIGHLGIIKGMLLGLGIEEDLQRKMIAAVDKKDREKLSELGAPDDVFALIDLFGKKEILAKAEELTGKYPAAKEALSELKDALALLDEAGADYHLNLGVARGLEYYTGMVFEMRVPELGAQSQICGGGRYDNLIELFSGLSVPAVGFAYGFDRVMEALAAQGVKPKTEGIDVVVAQVSSDVKKEAFSIAAGLRKDRRVYLELMDRKLGKVLEYASSLGARYAVIVGRKDLDKGEVTIRDLSSGEQNAVPLDKIEENLS